MVLMSIEIINDSNLIRSHTILSTLEQFDTLCCTYDMNEFKQLKENCRIK